MYLQTLQQTICDAISVVDSPDQLAKFTVDAWEKSATEQLQGNGITQMLEQGAPPPPAKPPVFERAGCGFSHVKGNALPPSATQKRPNLTGASFEAMGVSLVFHPHNPHIPTVHMNVRMLTAHPADSEPISWFGGGMDLTPYYTTTQDVIHFHKACQTALQPFGEDKYPRFKAACDAYFFLPHRNEARGVGGIFFDDFSEFNFAGNFAMLRAVGDAFLGAYLPIVERNKEKAFTDEEKAFQLYRRGRYAEFNLVWDRGTHFGLQSGGRTESILLSMPPMASWAYQKEFDADSAESKLYTDFLPPRDWLAAKK